MICWWCTQLLIGVSDQLVAKGEVREMSAGVCATVIIYNTTVVI
jgi:hypothetical protein